MESLVADPLFLSIPEPSPALPTQLSINTFPGIHIFQIRYKSIHDDLNKRRNQERTIRLFKLSLFDAPVIHTFVDHRLRSATRPTGRLRSVYGSVIMTGRFSSALHASRRSTRGAKIFWMRADCGPRRSRIENIREQKKGNGKRNKREEIS
jgi:hypothetical protein